MCVGPLPNHMKQRRSLCTVWQTCWHNPKPLYRLWAMLRKRATTTCLIWSLYEHCANQHSMRCVLSGYTYSRCHCDNSMMHDQNDNNIVDAAAFDTGRSPISIAILTPYKGQQKMIQKNFLRRFYPRELCNSRISMVQVLTLDGCQGSEFDLVLFSTVLLVQVHFQKIVISLSTLTRLDFWYFDVFTSDSERRGQDRLLEWAQCLR